MSYSCLRQVTFVFIKGTRGIIRFKVLPEKNHAIILQALSCYRGNQTMQVNDEIRLFVKNVSYMIQNNQ